MEAILLTGVEHLPNGFIRFCCFWRASVPAGGAHPPFAVEDPEPLDQKCGVRPELLAALSASFRAHFMGGRAKKLIRFKEKDFAAITYDGRVIHIPEPEATTP